MLKRWFQIVWVAFFVLFCLASSAFAQMAVEVCWKPSDLRSDVTTYTLVLDKKGQKWTILDGSAFWEEAKNQLVLRYNPKLGPDSLLRIPEALRPRSCTPEGPPPPKKPNAPKTKAPAPPTPKAPKKDDDEGEGGSGGKGGGKGGGDGSGKGGGDGSGKGGGDGSGKGAKDGGDGSGSSSDGKGAKDGKGSDPGAEKPEKPASNHHEKREEGAGESGPESYEQAHARNLKNQGFLPLCETLKRDKEHPKPENCPESPLPFAEDDPVLPPSEPTLPNAAENPLLPNEKTGGILPDAPKKPLDVSTTAPCEEKNGVCKKKTGDEKGPVEERTTAEKALEEAALAAGILNGQLGEDLKDPNGKKHGVLGGKNPNGIDHPAAQAVVVTLITLNALISPSQLKEQIERALGKNTRLVIKKVDKAGVEAIEKMVEDDVARLAAAEGLKASQSIAPYKLWKAITQKLGRKYQAHHIYEQRWAKIFERADEKALGEMPSVILTKEAHKTITRRLDEAAKAYGKKLSKEDLWRIYQDVYKDSPHWLKAIERYFK